MPRNKSKQSVQSQALVAAPRMSSARQRKSRKPPKKASPFQSITSDLIRALPEVIGTALSMFPTSNAHTIVGPSGGPLGQSMTAIAPAANGAMVRTTVPSVRNRVNGVRVCHREFLTNVVAPETDLTSQFNLAFSGRINPGNARVFPWLATIASRFESYLFRTLRFIYEMQSSTSNSGTVMIVIDYDTVDPPPASKEQMMSYVGATRSPPWFACVFNSAPGDLRKAKTYYVNATEENPPGTDPKTYFVGNVYCATEAGNLAAAQSWGELYVEYEVDLLTPVLDQSGGSGFMIGDTVDTTGSVLIPGSAFTKGTLAVTYDATMPIGNNTFFVEFPGLYSYTYENYGGGSVTSPITFSPANSNSAIVTTATNTAVVPTWNMDVSISEQTPGYNNYTGYFYVASPPGGIKLEYATGFDVNATEYLAIEAADPQFVDVFPEVPTSMNLMRSRYKSYVHQARSRASPRQLAPVLCLEQREAKPATKRVETPKRK